MLSASIQQRRGIRQPEDHPHRRGRKNPACPPFGSLQESRMKKTLRSWWFSAPIALALLWTPTAQAWDDGGHMLVDEIAARQLKPGVAKRIEALLPLLDTRFHQGIPYNLTTAGAWMDHMRALGREYPWSKWHYIDLPCTGNATRDFIEPSPPHALSALRNAIATLRTPNSPPEARAEAVAQIMHIVGDIHQPLHTATRNDRGGNGFPLAPLTSTGNPTNLHHFWDIAYRISPASSVGQADQPIAPGAIAQEASVLLAKYPPDKLPQLADPNAQTPHAWVRETHALACLQGWPEEAPPQKPVQLSAAFVATAHSLAQRQIVLAGCRLANLLNQVLGSEGN